MDREPPWSERHRPDWLPAGCLWSALTRRWRRPMTGFIATLTPEQTAAALAYRGDDHVGPKQAPPFGPESEGDTRSPVWGAGCGVDD